MERASVSIRASNRVSERAERCSPLTTSPSAIERPAVPSKHCRRFRFMSARDRPSRVVGESGSGKSTIALAALGCCRRKRRCRPVESCSTALTSCSSIASGRRQLRGSRIGLVFQDPFSVLNPSLRIGEQVGEGLVFHRGFSRGARLCACDRTAPRGRHRESGGGREGLPARALRRHAAARADRRCACG